MTDARLLLGRAARRHRKVARGMSAILGARSGPESKRHAAAARQRLKPILREVQHLSIADEVVLGREMATAGRFFETLRSIALDFDQHVCLAVEDDVRSACEPAGIAVQTLTWAAIYLAALETAFGPAWGDTVREELRGPWQAMLAAR